MLKILLRLLGYWRRHWVAVTLALGTAFLSLAADNLKPLALRYGVDHGVLASDEAALLTACAMIIGLYALRGVFAYCQAYMSEYLSQNVAYDLRNDLYNR